MAHAPSAHHSTATPGNLVTLSVPLGRQCCGACVELVERRLRDNPHVVRVHVDAPNEVAHVEAQRGKVTVAELAEIAAECCGGRCPVPMPQATVSSHDHAHTANVLRGDDAPEAHPVAHAEHAGMAHA